MLVANFTQKQPINFTYAKGGNKSYIDHVLIPSYMLDKLTHCAILQDGDNVSDHYAIHCALNFDIVPGTSYYEANNTFPATYWNKHDFCSQYKINLQKALACLDLVNPDMVISREQAAVAIDNGYDTLISTMHTATAGISVNPAQHRHKHWWTIDCSQAKAKNRFWRNVWIENGRPSQGVVYDCYKDTKRRFRRACRAAQQETAKAKYCAINGYMKHRNINKLWAAVRKTRNYSRDIQMPKEQLRDYLINKFSDSAVHETAQREVQQHFASSNVDKDFVFPDVLVRKYILKLRSTAAPGIDGISPHHFKQALDTDIILHLSALLTLCCRYSIVPEVFTQGLLVPIPKPGKDQATPQGYRPITISVIASKILEYYIIDECSQYKHNPLMFGFIQERGTDQAIALAHDVCQVTLAGGSPVHLASLDAEGAFDYIPHAVLFSKARHDMPTLSWKLMVAWYSRSKARLLIGRHLDDTEIPIRRGVRQGGLTSPLLFNVFYRQLIDTLSQHDGGVVVGKHRYNVFNYADDVLLASTTVGGLQRLLNTASEIISRDGLMFNPAKTLCSTFGPNIYTSDPQWYLNGTQLQNSDSIKYLGAYLGSKASQLHVQDRISAANKSYYALQAAGLHKDGVNPATAGYIHQTVIAPSLTYGCNAVHINKKELNSLDSCQGKLLKTNLGLYYTSRTSPLLQALRIQTATSTIEKETLGLLHRCLLSDSAARIFYAHQLQQQHQAPKTLIARARTICDKHSIHFNSILFNRTHRLKPHTNVASGLLDSILHCFSDFNQDNRIVLQYLVNSF